MFSTPIFSPWDQSFHYCTIILPEWNYPPDSSYCAHLPKIAIQMLKETMWPYVLLQGHLSKCACTCLLTVSICKSCTFSIHFIVFLYMYTLSLCAEAVKVVDHHPQRQFLICLFPPVPRVCNLVAITIAPPLPTGDYSSVSRGRLWVDPSSADCI